MGSFNKRSPHRNPRRCNPNSGISPRLNHGPSNHNQLHGQQSQNSIRLPVDCLRKPKYRNRRTRLRRLRHNLLPNHHSSHINQTILLPQHSHKSRRSNFRHSPTNRHHSNRNRNSNLHLLCWKLSFRICLRTVICGSKQRKFT